MIVFDETEPIHFPEDEFDDTKEVIRIRKPKKNKQHNGQKKKYNRTNSDLQNIHLKLKKWEISGLYLSIANVIFDIEL